MRLGIDSYSYHLHLGHYEYRPSQPRTSAWFLDRAAALGVDGVMLLEVDRSPSPEFVQAVRAQVERLGLFLEIGGGDTEPEHLVQWLEAAALLGCKVLKITERVDRWSRTTSLARQIGAVVDDLRAAAPLAESKDIRIALENHGRLTAAEHRWIVECVGSTHVGVCLDTGNSLLLQEDPVATCATLAPYAFTTHFKDASFGGTPYGAEILHVGLGDGVLDLRTLVAIIERRAPQPAIHIEVVTQPLEDEEASLRHEDETVARSVRYAREQLGIGR